MRRILDIFWTRLPMDLLFHQGSREVYEEWCKTNKPWNVIEHKNMPEFALAGQYVSLLFPCGHIKSTRTNDTEFIEKLRGVTKIKFLSRVNQLRQNIPHKGGPILNSVSLPIES